MSCPAHIELIAEEKAVEVAKEADETQPKLTKKRAAQLRSRKTVKVGEN